MKRKPIPNIFEQTPAEPAPIAIVPDPPADTHDEDLVASDPPAIPAATALATEVAPIALAAGPGAQSAEATPAATTRGAKKTARATKAPKNETPPQLKKVTFWITEGQHLALHRKTAKRMLDGEHVQISDVVRDAIDQYLEE